MVTNEEKTVRKIANLLGLEPEWGNTFAEERQGWTDTFSIYRISHGLRLTNGSYFHPVSNAFDREEIFNKLPIGVSYCYASKTLYDHRTTGREGTNEFWDVYITDESTIGLAICDVVEQWIDAQS